MKPIRATSPPDSYYVLSRTPTTKGRAGPYSELEARMVLKHAKEQNKEAKLVASRAITDDQMMLRVY